MEDLEESGSDEKMDPMKMMEELTGIDDFKDRLQLIGKRVQLRRREGIRK